MSTTTTVADVRKVKEAAEMFERAAKFTDLKEAFQMLAPLVGKPIEECRKPTKFNQESGKPTEYEYHPYRAWNGVLWLETGLGYNYPSLKKQFELGANKQEEDPLRKAILKQLKPGEAIFVSVGDEKFCVGFIGKSSSGGYGGGGMADSGGTIPAHLHFQKLREL